MKITKINIFVGAFFGLCFLIFAETAGADSHGNKYVHSRELNGQTYVMYQDHMSLYTYAKDRAGISNCYGSCLDNWIPATLDADTKLGKNYTLVKRSDGTMQAAFRSFPLYLYRKDQKPGDLNGDGIDGVWHLARP